MRMLLFFMRIRYLKLYHDIRARFFFFFSSRRRHTRFKCDWSSDVCSSDLVSSRDNLLLHFVLLGFLLGGLLGLLIGLLIALLHFRLLVVLHRLGAGVGRGQGRAVGNGERHGDQDGDQLPHVFPLREVKEQVVTSPLLRNQSLPVTPCPPRG